jgi:hypothetical protein
MVGNTDEVKPLAGLEEEPIAMTSPGESEVK